MTKAFLIVSVACNVWFLFLLFYDRIMDTKLIRFFRHIAGLWRSLDSTVAEQGKDKEIPHADTSDIIGKSRFKMASTRTTAAIPTQEAATSEKGNGSRQCHSQGTELCTVAGHWQSQQSGNQGSHGRRIEEDAGL